ncbi:hypothetical protein [Anabaena lutea]|uniref:Uncharacterized protein n=1 Tax=Anabaena lutea FACHB-196 TaxID=2692881 RepID=A0ABR8FBX6_9NOST|nr:hypothetical protein [Anabaena lutea]MBD2567269.1 hypothetical protein [Anabaena lutea FACHB-196]
MVKSQSNIINYQPRLAPMKEIIPATNNHNLVNTNGGNYNKNINGNYIQRDYIDQSITIGGQKVEISSDISQTIYDFKDILTEMIAKSSDPRKAISEFTEELVQELRRNPEAKINFSVQYDSSEEELVNNIIRILLTQDSSELENINVSNGLMNIKPIDNQYDSEKDYKNNIPYRGYTIELLNGINNRWIYKIKRKDNTFLENIKRGGSYREETAITKAKKEIDKELTEIFHNQESI